MALLPHPWLIALCGLIASGCGRSPVFVLDRGLDDIELDDEDEDPVVTGCPKVDFLFVIDDSASMLMYQRQLADNFGVFIEGVQETQAALESIHLGVVTTDAYAGNAEVADPSCHAIGGLITTTAGYNSSEAECGPYAEGHAYMTERDDLHATFPCAAQVGTAGSTEERPLQALTAAVDVLDQPGLCNDGFIRDDALLVVVIVTDEDDPGPVDYRYDRLVDVKDGYVDNIVMLGLINEPGTDCSLSGHSIEATVLTSFIGMFTHSFIAPVCGDYASAFQQAISVVEAACSDV